MQQQFEHVALSDLKLSPFDVRSTLDDAKMEELVKSIESSGLIEPIVGRRVNGKIEVVAGGRRLRAAKKAKLDTVPVIIQEMTDSAAMEAQLIENIQREDMSPLDEAEALHRLMKLDPATFTAEAVAKKIGLSAASVYLKLQLLKLQPEGRELLQQGKIDTAHGAALGRLTPTDQKEAVKWMRQMATHRMDKSLPTIKELRQWIKDHIRLDLFGAEVAAAQPKVAAALEKLKAKGIEPVQLSRHYETGEDHGVKVLGTKDYREVGKKKCEHAQPAAFVYGDEVQLTDVCTNRQKCKTHWKWEIENATATRRVRQNAKPARQTPEAKKRQAAAEAKVKRDRELQGKVATAAIRAAVKATKKISHDMLTRLVVGSLDVYQRDEDVMEIVEELKVPGKVLALSYNAMRANDLPKLSDHQLAGLAILSESDGVEHNPKDLEAFAKRHKVDLKAVRKGVEQQLAAAAEPAQPKRAAKKAATKKR